MTDRPISKRNPAPKAFPRLAWERDRYHAGVKNAHLVLGERLAVLMSISSGFVTIGRYFTSAHNGELDDIRAAARRCTEKMHPDRARMVVKALADAEGDE